jgi:nitrate/nitrite transport system permease protein
MFNPLISLLRPVSPLAWLPIGLLVFKAPTRPPSGPSSSARSGP